MDATPSVQKKQLLIRNVLLLFRVSFIIVYIYLIDGCYHQDSQLGHIVPVMLDVGSAEHHYGIIHAEFNIFTLITYPSMAIFI